MRLGRFGGLVAAGSLVLGLAIGCSKDEEKVQDVVNSKSADAPGDASASSLLCPTVYFSYDDHTLSASAQDVVKGISEKLQAASVPLCKLRSLCRARIN